MTENREPLSVLFAIPRLDTGGPDRVFFELLRSLDRTRVSPALVVEDGRGHYLSELGNTVPVSVLRRPGRTWSRYPADALLAAVWRERPAVVFTTLRMGFTAGLVRPFFPPGTLLVTRVANDYSTTMDELRRGPAKHQLVGGLLDFVTRRADLLIAQSEYMAKDLRSRFPEHPPVRVLYNPIDVDRARRLAEESVPPLRGQPALCTVGRLAPQKGVDILLPAFAMLRRNLPGAHLTVLGDGPERSALQMQARTLGVEPNVTWLGHQPNVLPYVGRADLFVLGSRYEGFSNAVLEAMALGRRIVTTSCPGANAEIIRHGETGWLCPAEDVDALFSTMVEALSASGPHSTLVSQTCRERFSSRIRARELCEMILFCRESAGF